MLFKFHQMPSLAVLALLKEYHRTPIQTAIVTKIIIVTVFRLFMASAYLVSPQHLRLIFLPGYMSDFLKKVPQLRHS